MDAHGLIKLAASPPYDRMATALDIALSDYSRRYGDVRLYVARMSINDRGVEFTVRAR